MSFLLPKLSTSSLLSHHTKFSQTPPTNPIIPSSSSPSSLYLQTKLTALQEKPHLTQAPDQRSSQGNNKNQKDDFYLNLGIAVRTLRDDLPSLFVRDLNYDIYRDDITFVDPLNTFQGIENYKLIFWALRFHGKILFHDIGLDITRIWQLSENTIVIRWKLHGTPRVPWEAHGTFEGTSRYKLDRNGKIYEHKVDNLAFNFPKAAVPDPAAVLDLVTAKPVTCPAGPTLGFLNEGDWLEGCTWMELYRKVKGTLEGKGKHPVGMRIEGLLSCS
ncbi:plant/protein (DUF2358) [Rhynchospora pubera]|uniref:Plant/protein (DUF2358) n=1 Tax=Rhynchospora pubera TaxID=906938 RepID=A0AAV8CK63_9POAL|nr:plant/protein (DUF2358) [Rhynchospora pubera]KAJ4754871.1 plant/protein (DUF2358) [Rhynchospora pubera]